MSADVDEMHHQPCMLYADVYEMHHQPCMLYADDVDEMHDITIREINNILENGGHCEIEVEEEHLDDDEASDYINIVPILFQGKITIRYDNDESVLDDDDDNEDWEDYHTSYDY